MSNASTAFWPAVEFVLGTTVGVATSPAASTLRTPLENFFLTGNGSSRPSGADQAASLAAILDNWTTHVTVVNTPAGSPSLPPVALF